MARPTTPARGRMADDSWGRALLPDHLGFVKRAADAAAREHKFAAHGQEAADLNSAGLLLACEVAERYLGTAETDPDGRLFRAYLKAGLGHELRREARRLRNGGTYWTRDETPGVALLALPLSDFDVWNDEHDETPVRRQGHCHTHVSPDPAQRSGGSIHAHGAATPAGRPLASSPAD